MITPLRGASYAATSPVFGPSALLPSLSALRLDSGSSSGEGGRGLGTGWDGGWGGGWSGNGSTSTGVGEVDGDGCTGRHGDEQATEWPRRARGARAGAGSRMTGNQRRAARKAREALVLSTTLADEEADSR